MPGLMIVLLLATGCRSGAAVGPTSAGASTSPTRAARERSCVSRRTQEPHRPGQAARRDPAQLHVGAGPGMVEDQALHRVGGQGAVRSGPRRPRQEILVGAAEGGGGGPVWHSGGHRRGDRRRGTAQRQPGLGNRRFRGDAAPVCPGRRRPARIPDPGFHRSRTGSTDPIRPRPIPTACWGSTSTLPIDPPPARGDRRRAPPGSGGDLQSPPEDGIAVALDLESRETALLPRKA
jgi:hypothetical protein